MPCARASPRSPASTSPAWPSRRPRARSSGSSDAAKAWRHSPPPRCGCHGRIEFSPMAEIMAGITEQELIAAARALLDLCRTRNLTIAAAESCTGGLLAATLTEIPGSSDVFDRAFVTYSNAAKQAMLDVPSEVLAR